jgi:hypothetical protein
MSTRGRILGFGTAALLVIAGIACAVFVPDGTGEVLILALMGTGFIVATSLVFLEVGLSEDRERAREGKRQPDGGSGPEHVEPPRLARSLRRRRRP